MDVHPTDATAKKRPFEDISASQSSHDSPPRKIQRTAPGYPASPEEHAKLDETMLEGRTIHSMATTWDAGLNFGHATFLLMFIVSSSPELDQQYINVAHTEQLIERNDWLIEGLDKAWKERKFSAIRNLAILQPPTQTMLPKPENRDSTTLAEEVPDTERAWITPYKGDAGHLLRETIATMNHARGDNVYANYLPIVQSSGTGKSRMVDEVAKTIFTIPINLRVNNKGFPRADSAIREFFNPQVIKHLMENKRETFNEALRRFLLFFRALFETVREEVEKMNISYSPECLASRWRNKLSTVFRNGLYRRIIEKANQAVETFEGGVPLDYPEPEALSTIEAGNDLVTAIHEVSGQSDSREEQGGIPNVPLMIYFDESQSLTTDTLGVDESSWSPWGQQGKSQGISDGDERTPYQCLCSALNILRKVNLFAIFLSTSSGLSYFLPPQTYSPAALYRNALIDTVQAPYVETPFDTWREDYLLMEGAHRLQEVCQPAFMVRFGRPLFWTRYESNDGVRGDIVNFARMKLTAGEDGPLAALSIRLLLEFEPRRARAVDAESRLVEGHLRVAYSVPAHREYLHSGTPSEPIIAEAAAQVLQDHKLPQSLRKCVQNGLISKGERGELVARLLVTLAHDQAVRSTLQDRPSGVPMHFSTPITVTDFLRALFSNRFVETILDCRPDNESDGRPLREAFAGASVHFTHFAKAEDDSVVSDNQAWMALCRGIAWQCHNQQPSIDMLIPIALRTKGKLCRWNVSAIALSIRDRRLTLGSAQTPIDLDRMGFFSPMPSEQIKATAATEATEGKKTAEGKRGKEAAKGTEVDDDPELFPSRRPYIALTLQLGVQPKQPKETAPNPPAPSSPTASTSLPSTDKVKISEIGGGKTCGREDVEHPRYNITALGCSNHVYCVVDDADKNLFAELLASRTLFDEHPLQKPKHLEAIQRLKASWKAGPGSYHGIKRMEAVESDSAVPPPDLTFEGDVIVGGCPYSTG